MQNSLRLALLAAAIVSTSGGFQRAAAQSFGGLSMESTCTSWQGASSSARSALIDDLLTGYSMNTRQTLNERQRAEAQACMASLFRAPCATGSMSVRSGLASCLTMLGIRAR
jgi:hypothetical protein